MSTNRAVAVAVLLLAAAPLFAATFTVTSSSETGPGTLTQAILDANATPGRDQIRFAVPSAVMRNATGGATLGTATATIVIASHMPEEAIPTASTWGLMILAASLACIALRRG